MECSCKQILKIAYALTLVAVAVVLTTPGDSMGQLISGQRQFRAQMSGAVPPSSRNIPLRSVKYGPGPNPAQAPPSPYLSDGGGNRGGGFQGGGGGGFGGGKFGGLCGASAVGF